MIGMVTLRDGTTVPSLGQGTWHMGEGRSHRATEAAALREGIDLGMSLLDTAEMYADGGAEEVVGEAMAGQRDRVFVVTKITPQHATRHGMAAACARSLKRLHTDRIDLYLLHWRGSVPLAETVAGFQALIEAGHIRRWGVSNLDTAELTQLSGLPGGDACAANQVLYNLEARGVEFDLLPWCAARSMPVIAYSPVGQGRNLLRAAVLRRVAERHEAQPAQVALAWTLRRSGIVSIPKAADPAHVRENAAAVTIKLSEADLAELDAAFPPPHRKRPLGML